MPALARPQPASPAAERHDAEFIEIARLLALAPGASVADVGAGGGAWTFRLADVVGATGRVYGTDVRAPQVESIRRGAARRGRGNVTAILGTEDDTGLPAGCCDAVLLRLVYHAMDKPDRMRASLHGALKPGGRLLVIDFKPALTETREQFETAGFEAVEAIPAWQGQDGVYAILFRRARGE